MLWGQRMSQEGTAGETQLWEMQLTSSYPHFGEGPLSRASARKKLGGL